MATVSIARFVAAASVGFLLAACAGARPSTSARPSHGATPAPSDPAASVLPTASASAAPIETAAPVVTIVPSEPPAAPEGNYLAGLRYTCGGADFPIEMFDTPEHAEDSDDPPAAVLRSQIMIFEPVTWWLIDRTATRAQYAGIGDSGTYWDLEAELKDGAWRATGYGNCLIRAFVPDARVVTWWIRKDDWPSPDDRTIDVTVRDGCPKTVADRMLDPIVRSNAESIVIIVPTQPAPQTPCGFPDDSEQRAPVTIHLDEPVGDRNLFDGETLPLRDAHQRSEQLYWCCG